MCGFGLGCLDTALALAFGIGWHWLVALAFGILALGLRFDFVATHELISSSTQIVTFTEFICLFRAPSLFSRLSLACEFAIFKLTTTPKVPAY